MRTANFGSNLDACLLSHLTECHHFVWYINLCIRDFLLIFCLVLNWTFGPMHAVLSAYARG